MSIYSDIQTNQTLSSDNARRSEHKAWLLSFTDLVMLMLSFFIMLYAMSNPNDQEWSQIKTALSTSPAQMDLDVRSATADLNAEEITEDLIPKNIKYIYSLIEGNLSAYQLDQDVSVTLRPTGIWVSVAEDDMFTKTGYLTVSTQKILIKLIPLLNKMNVPVSLIGQEASFGQVQDQWESSLYRAYIVGGFLGQNGLKPALRYFAVGAQSVTFSQQEQKSSSMHAGKQRVDFVLGYDGGRL